MPVFRIPVPIASPLTARVSDVATSRLQPRDDDPAKKPDPKPETTKPSTASIAAAAVIVGIIAIVAGVILLRFVRSRNPNPKYIPTKYLKDVWTRWKVPTRGTPHAYKQTGADDDSMRQTNLARQQSLGDELTETQAGNGAAGAPAVDRNTSVRSVMTLPVYRPKATDTEQVLAREGERDGIDVVVEMPTAEDDEALREEEMAALYGIRAARRRQIAEREERRRLRREAREANNIVALQELRDQARGQASRNLEEIEELRQGHERIRETRQRAVSSVSYADLGVVRADGTRLRANSNESERMGLLSDAASIGASTASGSLFHRRDRSGSSALSIDTSRINDQLESPGLTATGSSYSLASTPGATGRSRANSGVTTPRASSATTRAGSSPEIIDAEDVDLGDTSMPPPGYEDVSLDEFTPAPSGRNSPYNEPPPDYPGPAQVRNNRLSAQMEDLATQAQPNDARNGRSPNGTPQLPSLRLDLLPQIVIEPSSALPRADER
ncbi:hypothetical protein B0T26DRAFT_746655 [Lasiosphaeria miniovina]|uniref:Uncharacterized protein n=1 Tax=Lasiosphaeria miniovina TaxID=1954250 RepID=A0AA40BIE4_9PEZI|nr:uncharacterized protein B0T26DRAFT_746655 [Lasiosphaeria miniovina]KAK0734791.1 hypothetical protein B0T26DRAFT_746655 [Lasiosphaeria miniovina]